MRKIADVFFCRRDVAKDFFVNATSEMSTEDQAIAEDVLRDSKVKMQIDNACKDVMSMSRGDKDVSIANLSINLGNTSIESKIKVEIILLKVEDKSDLKVSIYSLVNVPNN